MEPRKPGDQDEFENWAPESGDSPERERRANGELAFEEQGGRSSCDLTGDEAEEEKSGPGAPEKKG